MFLIQLLFLLCLTNQQSILSDTVITLERTECYGRCPSYQLSISADGRVVFTGKRFVKKVGKHRGRISQDQLKQLIAEFQRIEYFSLKDDYGMSEDSAPSKDCPEMWTDYPAAYTSLSMNGKTKKVAHYHGCKGSDAMEKLTQLENRIDEIVNTSQWIK